MKFVLLITTFLSFFVNLTITNNFEKSKKLRNKKNKEKEKRIEQKKVNEKSQKNEKGVDSTMNNVKYI